MEIIYESVLWAKKMSRKFDETMFLEALLHQRFPYLFSDGWGHSIEDRQTCEDIHICGFQTWDVRFGINIVVYQEIVS
jgi:hypothetical protein